ncbi:MAG: carbohydrate ABC transporter permease [bacterium]
MSDTSKQMTLSDWMDTTQGRVVITIVTAALTVFILGAGFLWLRANAATANRFVVAIFALVIGVGGIWGLFYSLNNLTELLPEGPRDKLLPYVFMGPAVLVLGFYLVYPTLNTTYLSFMDNFGNQFVGLENYIYIFSNPAMLVVLRNTLLWVLLVPTIATALGLLIAVITDRFRPGAEKLVKSLVFLPMAISFVGASVIWRFVYAFQPAGLPQIGLLNALVTALGGEPVAWITVRPWNNLLLIFIMIWLQTGFAMVIQSAAVKGVPKDLIEAARIDGAGEIRSFFNVTIPYISTTILTVGTTIVFLVLKIFDVVYVMTSGSYGTNIVALRMYQEAFVQRNFGRGSALAVFLFVVVIPLMVQNARALKDRSK